MQVQADASRMSSSVDEYALLAIEPEELGNVWSLIEPLVLKTIDGMNGRHTLQSLLAEVMEHDLALWAVVSQGQGLQALVGTQIAVSSSGLRSLVIRFTVGKGIHDWVYLLDQLEDYARSVGCQRVETWARKGWAKHMPDYKLTHVLLEKDLI
jgi:hypothetical protein